MNRNDLPSLEYMRRLHPGGVLPDAPVPVPKRVKRRPGELPRRATLSKETAAKMRLMRWKGMELGEIAEATGWSISVCQKACFIVSKMARMGYSARHERIRTLMEKGASQREVVRITGWSRGLVRYLISQMEAGL